MWAAIDAENAITTIANLDCASVENAPFFFFRKLVGPRYTHTPCPPFTTPLLRCQAERCRRQMELQQLSTHFQTPASSNQSLCLSGLTTGRQWKDHTGKMALIKSIA